MRLKAKNQWLLTGGLAALLTGGSLAWWMHGAHASGIPSANALHYAGTLNEKGVPVDGPRDITVILWKDANSVAATDQLCVTAAGSTPVAAGRFEVPLVDDCTAKVTANPDSWAEVQVGGVSYGRQKIGAVPYAVIASVASLVDGAVKSTAITPHYTADGALGRGDGDASIYNDGTGLKALAITGNNSAGGTHKIGLYDDVTVGGNLNVGSALTSATANITGKLTADSMPANYDSGWQAVTSSSGEVTFPHGLGQIPARITLLICGQAVGTAIGSLAQYGTCTTRVVTSSGTGYQDGTSDVNPLTTTSDTTNVYLGLYSGYLVYDYWSPTKGWNCPATVTDCSHAYYRILAWKGVR